MTITNEQLEKLEIIGLMKDLKFRVDNCDGFGAQMSQKKIGKILENHRNLGTVPEEVISTFNFQSEGLTDKFNNECTCRKRKRSTQS